MDLDGKTALVTGGGRGIGAACARALAAQGARVAVCARTRTEVEGVAATIGAGSPALECDVTDEESVRATVRSCLDLLGPVDILVNNAGSGKSSPLKEETLESWNGMLAVNATGPFLCTRELLPGMMERGWGRVVNVASVAGLSGARYIAAYSAAKHAVIGLTRSCAAEAARRGVTVNAVCPGYVDTPMTDGSLSRIMERTGRSRGEALEALLSTTPQRRLIESEEVAAQVLFLCGEGARGITGQALVMDGGASLGWR